MPVQRKFELIINLITAKQIGVKIALTVLSLGGEGDQRNTPSDKVVESCSVGFIRIKASLQQSNIRIRRLKFCLTLCASFFALCPTLNAQSINLPRIGYLSASSSSEAAPRTEAFRQGLRNLGYVEGKNLIIEFGYADGNFDRIPTLISELIRLKVNVLVTAGPSLTGPAKQATTTIPIVMTNDNDPVGNGFVASLARPGGNITGLTGLARELSGKRLELLKEIFPKLSRAAILGISDIPGNAEAVKETERGRAAWCADLVLGDPRSKRYRDGFSRSQTVAC